MTGSRCTWSLDAGEPEPRVRVHERIETRSLTSAYTARLNSLATCDRRSSRLGMDVDVNSEHEHLRRCYFTGSNPDE